MSSTCRVGDRPGKERADANGIAEPDKTGEAPGAKR